MTNGRKTSAAPLVAESRKPIQLSAMNPPLYRAASIGRVDVGRLSDRPASVDASSRQRRQQHEEESGRSDHPQRGSPPEVDRHEPGEGGGGHLPEVAREVDGPHGGGASPRVVGAGDHAGGQGVLHPAAQAAGEAGGDQHQEARSQGHADDSGGHPCVPKHEQPELAGGLRQEARRHLQHGGGDAVGGPEQPHLLVRQVQIGCDEGEEGNVEGEEEVAPDVHRRAEDQCAVRPWSLGCQAVSIAVRACCAPYGCGRSIPLFLSVTASLR